MARGIRVSLPVLLVLPSLALAILACSGERSGRVLLLGIDGATFRVLEPLMAEGRLPNLARLAKEGASGPLRSLEPMMSPRIWNTIATGKVPEKHGIVAFALRDADGVMRLQTSRDRRTHALWKIASDAGLDVAVINWWNTHPPERVNGVIVSDHLLPHEIAARRELVAAVDDARGALVSPADWQARLAPALEDPAPPVDFADPFAPGDALPPWVDAAALSTKFREDGALVRIALELDAHLHPDLMMLLLTGVDRASHHLWGNLEPAAAYPPRLRPTEAQRRAGVAALESYYEYTDALAGLLLDRYDADDLVLVVSDHGFEPGVVRESLTGIHDSEKAIEGVVFARGPSIAPGTRITGMRVQDVAPSVLAWLGLPAADDMDGAKAAFVGRSSPRRIPTYDTTPVEYESEAGSGADAVLMERLRALGYVD